MAANGPKKTASPLPIIAILAVLGGAYYATSQLKSSRPEAPTGMTHAVSEKGKIDARLWQDPLKVACEHEKTFHGKGNNYAFEISPLPLISGERPIYIKQISDYESNAKQISKNESKVKQIGKHESDVKESPPEHSIKQVTERIRLIDETWCRDVNTPVHILLTMVRDDITAEDHERRLRNRYAMVTALYSSGFVPEDPMHIQYFRLPWIERNELEEKVDPQNVPESYRHLYKIVEDPNYTSEPLIVPYEWFKQEEVYLNQTANTGKDDPPKEERPKEKRPKHVLLVWLPEGAFSHWPMTRLAQVIEAIGHDPNSVVRIDMIGPSRSGTLRTMLSEIIDLLGSDKILKEKLKDIEEKLKDIEEMINDIDLKLTVNTNTEKLAELKNRKQRLEKLLAELKNCKQRLEKLKVLSGVTIFSPWSTTSPALLVKNRAIQDANNTSLSKMYKVIPDEFKKIDVNFIRMIGSDDLLAMELINELKRRGVDVLPKDKDKDKDKDKGDKGPHIALISEWDTFYGNAFPLTFATMMESIDPNNGQPKNWLNYMIDLNRREQIRASNFPWNLHIYSYIRGVDGKLPQSQSSKEEKSSEKSEANSKLTYTKGLEPPTGRSQLDYIRRLTQKLSDRFKYFGNNKLKAIGVVGSDVYDKLVLLQSLREQFSDMIIFTIDLDARMMHQEQLKWTRNVIVASNYGLELSDRYQSGIYQHREDSLPPFRDNYQTSLFLACRTSLGLRPYNPNDNKPDSNDNKSFREMGISKLTKVISHPQLFEIGQDRAVNLTVSNKEDVFGIHPPRTSWPGWKVFLKERGFITKGDFITERDYQKRVIVILFVIGILFLTYFVVKISSGLGKIVPLMSIKELTFSGVIAKVLGLVVILSMIISFIAIVIFDHYREGGEPFSLDAGVSIWPGEILRLTSVIVGFYLIIRLVNKLQDSEKKLGNTFFETSKPVTEGRQAALLQRMEGCYDWLFFSLGLGRRSKDKKEVIAQDLWKKYLLKSKWSSRFLRVLPMTLGYMVLSGMVINIFGYPNTPFRGNISFRVNQSILILSGIYMIILIFFVVDATYLCLNRLAEPLIKLHTKWPDGAVEDFKADPEIKPNDVTELLDVRFVTKLTENIGKMIYWPFIVLAVMAASRFPYFDNWNFPISLIIIYAIPSICLLICAIALQRTAKEVRAKALNYLNKQLLAARFGKDENRRRVLKLTRLIREIESMREGAFRPFYENPVIHVILGSGGAGLLALLKYMPLS